MGNEQGKEVESDENFKACPLSDPVTSACDLPSKQLDADSEDSAELVVVPKEMQVRAKDLLKMLNPPSPQLKGVARTGKANEKVLKAEAPLKLQSTIRAAKIKEPGPQPHSKKESKTKGPLLIQDNPKVGKTIEERLILREKLFSKLPPVTEKKLPIVEKIEDMPELPPKSRKEVASWILDILDHSCSETTLRKISKGRMDMHDLQRLKKRKKKSSKHRRKKSAKSSIKNKNG